MGLRDRLLSADRLRALRGALARRFLLKVKRATHRAPARLIAPSAERVLVIAPHMDDEAIGCGGTLALLREQGAEVHIVFASDSSAGLTDAALAERLAEVRRGEAERVRSFMGFTSIIELGLPDGRLHQCEEDLASKLAERIRTLRPDLIFAPFPADAHSDHMACAAALASAAMSTDSGADILAYEVWTPLWPNVAVDISAVADRKEQAIRLYASQQADRDYAGAVLGLNRYRGLALEVDCAEAFHRTTPAGFADLCSLLDKL